MSRERAVFSDIEQAPTLAETLPNLERVSFEQVARENEIAGDLA